MTRPVRVLSVPADHAYVRHAIGRPGPVDDGLLVLPDPPVPGAAPGVWWPHPGLEPEWVRRHRHEFDVVHVHFGFEHRTPAQLTRWVDQLTSPLVMTVHDLQLPLTVDQATHEERTGVLLDAAAAVVTLTPGSAAEIAGRWGVRARVLPHPRMASLTGIRHSARPARREVTVGLHLKGLRANHGGAPLIRAAAAAVARQPDTRLLIHAHEELRSGQAEEVIDVLDQSTAAGARVEWVPRMDDTRFHDYLRGIDVSIVPHRWGTHSGWLEECLDHAVVPVTPAVGHLAEQADVPTYRWDGDTPEPDSLDRALAAAAGTARRGRTPQEAQRWAAHRERQDEATRAAYRELYREVTS